MHIDVRPDDDDGICATQRGDTYTIHIPAGTTVHAVVNWLFREGNLPVHIRNRHLASFGFGPGCEPTDIYRVWPPHTPIHPHHIPHTLRP